MFIENIRERAKKNQKTIVLPESGDVRTLKAAESVVSEGVAKAVLLGNPEEVAALAKENGVNLNGITIVDPANYDKSNELAEYLFELRKSKGMTLETAKELLVKDSLYLGVMMVKKGLADGMVAGAVRSSADVLRPALQIIKTAPGASVVSTSFFMAVPNTTFGLNGVFAFADCALNQNPNPEELASIAVSTASTFRSLTGEEPVVAMLSHSTRGTSKHADVDKVTEATRIAKEKAPDLRLDGEMQADAAMVPAIGQKKAPDSNVAGQANVLVFPDLDSGNIGYKLVERLAKASAYGPVTQGLALPVNDLSRGCSAEDIAGTIAITALQAGN